VHAVIGLPWAAAFVLGAIVSPTDAIAATTVAQRLGVPRRIVTILEGESLVNDATGIVAYRLAVAAVITGAFSF
jgi:monovalent cation/hydrogen antiporter